MSTPHNPAHSSFSHALASSPASWSSHNLNPLSPMSAPIHVSLPSSSSSSLMSASYEPRVVRGPTASRAQLPASSSGSAGATRGTATMTISTRGALARRMSQGIGRRPTLLSPTTATTPTTSSHAQNQDSGPSVFGRPAYLNHSVLRDLLQTDTPVPIGSVSASVSGNSTQDLPATATTSTNAGGGGFTPRGASTRSNPTPDSNTTTTSTNTGSIPGLTTSTSFVPPPVQLGFRRRVGPAPGVMSVRDATPTTDSDDESSIRSRSQTASLRRGESLPPALGHSSHGNNAGASGSGSGSGGAGGRTMSTASPVLRLPTRWSDQDRHSNLTVSSNGRDLTYHGPAASSEREAAAARTNHPVPPACGVFYYEVEVLQKGQRGFISVGFSAPEVKLHRLPGWERRSWGYHGDDGCSFAADKTGVGYGPTFGTGDVIGCGIDFTQHRAFYTKNGVLLPFIFDGIGRDCELFPAVGLRHPDESVRANFGHVPFVYDIASHARLQCGAVWNSILSMPVTVDDATRGVKAGEIPRVTTADGLAPAPLPGASTSASVTGSVGAGRKSEEERRVGKDREMDSLRPVLDGLVAGYLRHCGFVKTASAFGESVAARDREAARTDGDAEMASVEEPTVPRSSRTEEEMTTRIAITTAVRNGESVVALEGLQRDFPSALEGQRGGLVRLKLECAEFVAMVDRLGGEGILDSLRGDEEEADGTTNGEENGDGSMDVDEQDQDPRTPTLGTNGNGHATTGSSILDGTPSPDPEHDKGKGKETFSGDRTPEALARVLEFGKTLHARHRRDDDPEVRALLSRTFGVLALGGEHARRAVEEVRSEREGLAEEVNRAILVSQGQQPLPALERAWRQAQTCVMQLGLMGVGVAAYADVREELMD